MVVPFRVGVCALCFPVLGQQIVRPSRFEAVDDDGDGYDGDGTGVMTPALFLHSYLGLCLCTVFARCFLTVLLYNSSWCPSCVVVSGESYDDDNRPRRERSAYVCMLLMLAGAAGNVSQSSQLSLLTM